MTLRGANSKGYISASFRESDIIASKVRNKGLARLTVFINEECNMKSVFQQVLGKSIALKTNGLVSKSLPPRLISFGATSAPSVSGLIMAQRIGGPSDAAQLPLS